MKRIAGLLVGGILAFSASTVQADHNHYRSGYRGSNWGCNTPNYYSGYRSSYSAYRPAYGLPYYGNSYYGSQPFGTGLGVGVVGGGFGNAPFPPYGAYGIGSPFNRGPGVSLYIGR